MGHKYKWRAKKCRSGSSRTGQRRDGGARTWRSRGTWSAHEAPGATSALSRGVHVCQRSKGTSDACLRPQTLEPCDTLYEVPIRSWVWALPHPAQSESEQALLTQSSLQSGTTVAAQQYSTRGSGRATLSRSPWQGLGIQPGASFASHWMPGRSHPRKLRLATMTLQLVASSPNSVSPFNSASLAGLPWGRAPPRPPGPGYPVLA